MEIGSRFGAVLDMVTDRSATAILVLILSHLYFEYRFFCMLMIILDIVSHWLRVYSTLLRNEQHKKVSRSTPYLLRVYYENRTILGLLCLFNELFYIFAYMNYFFGWILIPFTDISFFYLATVVCLPLYSLKQIINVIQLCNSSLEIVTWELENEIKPRYQNPQKNGNK